MRGAKIIVVLVLMAVGMKNADIKKTLGTSWDSLAKYRQALDDDNLDPLFNMPTTNRQKSEMENFNEQIDASFNANPPKTLREARERIREITGLDRSITRVRKYLLKRGLKIGL
jgi:transposase